MKQHSESVREICRRIEKTLRPTYLAPIDVGECRNCGAGPIRRGQKHECSRSMIVWHTVGGPVTKQDVPF